MEGWRNQQGRFGSAEFEGSEEYTVGVTRWAVGNGWNSGERLEVKITHRW